MSSILSVHPFAPLIAAHYITVTTFRKNGAPVATPLWFVEHAGTLYAHTQLTSGKVKRIQHNINVLIAPCTSSGIATEHPVAAIARIVTDPDEEALAEQLLSHKYGMMRKIYYGFFDLTRLMRHRAKPSMIVLAFELGDPNTQPLRQS